jgi:hypothetical protein
MAIATPASESDALLKPAGIDKGKTGFCMLKLGFSAYQLPNRIRMKPAIAPLALQPLRRMFARESKSLNRMYAARRLRKKKGNKDHRWLVRELNQLQLHTIAANCSIQQKRWLVFTPAMSSNICLATDRLNCYAVGLDFSASAQRRPRRSRSGAFHP